MERPTKEIFDDVIDAVACVYRLESRDIISNSRKRALTEARQMAMYVLFQDFKFQEYIITGLFLRARSTVRNELKSFGGSVEIMKDLQYKYITIKDILNL